MTFRALVLGLALIGSACGGGDDDGGDGTGQPDASGAGGGDGGPGAADAGTNPTGNTITLTLEPFDVQPGTERQVCKKLNLPVATDAYVVKFRSTMMGTSHHFNAYKVLGKTDPVSPSEAQVRDCQPAAEQLSGDAAYIFGSASPELSRAMPAGVAFHLLPNQQIILEQHVINFTDGVVQGGVTFEITLADESANIQHHADVMWMGNWGFFLPPGTMTSDTTFCNVPYDVEIFALTSHTHRLGVHFSIEKKVGSQLTHLYDSYDWEHPPYTEYAPTISLKAGEGLQWTCTWNNTTSSSVQPGKNSTDEMCITFAYGYPKNSLLADPIQCNNFF